MKNKKTISIIAGISFFLWTVFYVSHQLSVNGFYMQDSDKLNIWTFPELLAGILLAVACFAFKPIIGAIGGAVYAVVNVRSLIMYIQMKEVFYYGSSSKLIAYYKLILAEYILLTIFSIMIIIMALTKDKKAKILGLITAVIPLLVTVIYLVLYPTILKFAIKPLVILRYIAIAIGSFMMGWALSIKEAEEINDQTLDEMDSEKLDMLVQLKILVEKGIITEEDYEEKKRILMEKDFLSD